MVTSPKLKEISLIPKGQLVPQATATEQQINIYKNIRHTRSTGMKYYSKAHIDLFRKLIAAGTNKGVVKAHIFA